MQANGNYDYGGTTIRPPMTYPKLKGVMIFLPISYEVAKNIINDDIVTPIRITPKQAILGLTVFDFIDCPVGPYRELALTIPVSINFKYGPNICPLIFENKLNKYLAFYTVLLAMNTASGRDHASAMFGYPVYENLLNISIEYSDDQIGVSIKEGEVRVIDFSASISRKYSEQEKFYQTIFRNNNSIKQVDLSASTVESSTSFKRLNNFVLGKHSVSNIINNLGPTTRSLRTSFYKNATETLSKQKNLNT